MNKQTNAHTHIHKMAELPLPKKIINLKIWYANAVHLNVNLQIDEVTLDNSKLVKERNFAIVNVWFRFENFSIGGSRC